MSETALFGQAGLSRRALLRGALGLSAVAFLAACGGDDDDDDEASEPTNTAGAGGDEPEGTATEAEAPAEATTTEGSSDSGAAFPVTIEHMFGETTIEELPARIVSVGWIEQDALLALGVVPVATTEWVGGHPGAIHPWAQDELGNAPLPEVLSNADGIEFERVAALKPDLILALYGPFDMTQEMFDRLAQIAPTVGPPAGVPLGGISWQELTRTVGIAVGQADRAAQIVADVEGLFEQVQIDHPEFVGALGLNAYPANQENFQAYPPPDPGGRLVTDLGFEVPQEILDIAAGEAWVNISRERIDLVDIDMMLWLVDDFAMRDALLEDPLYAGLNVAKEGRHIFLSYVETPDLAAATSIQTVLSLPFLLEHLVPMLAAAMDGDPATEPQASDDAEPEPQASATRTVVHAMGTTEVPARPQRVVVLEEGPLNSCLALGITPVGAVTAFADAPFPDYLAGQAEGVKTVGTILEPDLEAVAALQPDLILSIKSRHEEIYPQLAEIAPTVFSETVRCCWKDNFLVDAEALGKRDEGEQILDDYWQRLEEFKTAMGDRLATTEVSVVRFVPPADVYLYLNSAYIGTILADAGLPRPPAQDVDDFVLQVSAEQIREMDGDVIFITAYGPPEETTLEEFRSNPLWQQLEAVQQDKVYVVPDEYWMVGIGIIAAHRVIDDLFTYLVEGER